MRTNVCPTALLLLGCSALLLSPALASPPAGGEYRIVFPQHPVAPGERIELKLVPPPPAGARLHGSAGVRDLVYQAPFLILPGAAPVRISVGYSLDGVRAEASAEIDLLPGSVPGAEDCLGPGQKFSAVSATIEPEFTFVDELPQLIHRVEPVFPRSDVARNVEDVITVRALVCRSGRVLDAYAPPTYRDPRDPLPIPRDPKLVEAALDAVRQYEFRPGRSGGQAMALWVDTSVRFAR